MECWPVTVMLNAECSNPRQQSPSQCGAVWQVRGIRVRSQSNVHSSCTSSVYSPDKAWFMGFMGAVHIKLLYVHIYKYVCAYKMTSNQGKQGLLFEGPRSKGGTPREPEEADMARLLRQSATLARSCPPVRSQSSVHQIPHKAEAAPEHQHHWYIASEIP